MKLIQVDFCLDWPGSIEVINLRKYVISHLIKKGEVIRWSIIDIENSMEAYDIKKLRINAILAN